MTPTILLDLDVLGSKQNVFKRVLDNSIFPLAQPPIFIALLRAISILQLLKTKHCPWDNIMPVAIDPFTVTVSNKTFVFFNIYDAAQCYNHSILGYYFFVVPQSNVFCLLVIRR